MPPHSSRRALLIPISAPRAIPGDGAGQPALSAVVFPLTVRELPAAPADLRFWNAAMAPLIGAGADGEGRPRQTNSFNCELAPCNVIRDALDTDDLLGRLSKAVA